MRNDKVIRLIRVLASTAIGLTALVAAALLLYHGIVVPAPWWLIAVLAVGGVTGADVIAAVLQHKGVETEDGH
jgi:hypothetical protein